MEWAPSAVAGPSILVARDFIAGGFDIAVGFRHFMNYDPNPVTQSTGLEVATLGLLALPKGALLGNEHGLDLVSRPHFLSDREALLETALRPVLRIKTENSRFSFPSALGTLLPAVGVTALSTEKGAPHAALESDYETFLLRWSFDVRVVLLQSPVYVFAEASPSAELLVPFNGSKPHATFAACLNVGFTVMEN